MNIINNLPSGGGTAPWNVITDTGNPPDGETGSFVQVDPGRIDKIIYSLDPTGSGQYVDSYFDTIQFVTYEGTPSYNFNTITRIFPRENFCYVVTQADEPEIFPQTTLLVYKWVPKTPPQLLYTKTTDAKLTNAPTIHENFTVTPDDILLVFSADINTSGIIERFRLSRYEIETGNELIENSEIIDFGGIEFIAGNLIFDTGESVIAGYNDTNVYVFFRRRIPTPYTGFLARIDIGASTGQVLEIDFGIDPGGPYNLSEITKLSYSEYGCGGYVNLRRDTSTQMYSTCFYLIDYAADRTQGQVIILDSPYQYATPVVGLLDGNSIAACFYYGSSESGISYESFTIYGTDFQRSPFTLIAEERYPPYGNNTYYSSITFDKYENTYRGLIIYNGGQDGLDRSIRVISKLQDPIIGERITGMATTSGNQHLPIIYREYNNLQVIASMGVDAPLYIANLMEDIVKYKSDWGGIQDEFMGVGGFFFQDKLYSWFLRYDRRSFAFREFPVKDATVIRLEDKTLVLVPLPPDHPDYPQESPPLLYDDGEIELSSFVRAYIYNATSKRLEPLPTYYNNGSGWKQIST